MTVKSEAAENLDDFRDKKVLIVRTQDTNDDLTTETRVNDSHPTNEQNLDWLAFQYVSGELSQRDSVVFEERLATDPIACEAVARQVMICESIAVASDPAARVSVIGNRSIASTSARWVGVAIAAACLAIVVWAGSAVSPDIPSLAALDPSKEPSVSTSDDLAGYWVDVWVDVKTDLHQPADLLSFQMDNLLDVTSDEPEDSGEVVPDWMLAAVSTQDMVDDLMPEETRE